MVTTKVVPGGFDGTFSLMCHLATQPASSVIGGQGRL
jgi:hypothetical protein